MKKTLFFLVLGLMIFLVDRYLLFPLLSVIVSKANEGKDVATTAGMLFWSLAGQFFLFLVIKRCGGVSNFSILSELEARDGNDAMFGDYSRPSARGMMVTSKLKAGLNRTHAVGLAEIEFVGQFFCQSIVGMFAAGLWGPMMVVYLFIYSDLCKEHHISHGK